MGIDNQDNPARIARIAWLTGVTMTAAFLIANLSAVHTTRVIFDNVQWTIAQFGAALLAWLGYRHTHDEDRSTRRWFFFGLSSYALGQLLWDVQVLIGYTPFPAPSDVFYAACAPCIAIGLWLAVQRRVQPARAHLLLLDIIMLGVQTLAIILVIYMANMPVVSPPQLLGLAVYPIVMFGTAIVALMMAAALGMRLAWRWALLPLSLVLTGVAWMSWNIVAIKGTPQSGSWLNYLFAVASLMRGLGVARWDVASAQPVARQRRDAVLFLLMPLLPVIAAVTTVFMVWDAADLPRILRVAVMAASAAVILLAVVRQAYALTERERLLQAERSMVETEQQYRVLAQRFELATSAAKLGIWDIDLTKRRTAVWEPRMYELFGYNMTTELSPYDIWDQALHRDDVSRVRKQFATVIKGGGELVLEYRIVTQAGEVRYLEANGIVLHDTAGRAMRMIGVSWNVTDQVMARRALAESEAELSAIFENSVLGIVLVDEQRNILRHNRAARRLLGYSAAEAAQARAEDIIHPEESELSRQLFNALKTGQRDNYQLEKRYLRRDGVALWVRVTVYPVTLAARHDYVVLIEDISQRRVTEEQLSAAQQSQLRAREEFAFTLLKAQEQERQRIAYELHDGLSQSLSVIKNRAELALAQLPGDSQAAPQLQSILRVTSDAIAEARGLAHNLRPLHIEQLGLTAALAQLLSQFAEASGIEVESRLESIDDAIPVTHVTHVYRLLQEALNNIGKHAQATRVNVSTERDVHAVRIVVSDNGRGFDVSAATRTGGLGLNSMTERAHMLGGQIAFTSSASGSSVQMTIPISEAPLVDAGINDEPLRRAELRMHE